MFNNTFAMIIIVFLIKILKVELNQSTKKINNIKIKNIIKAIIII